MENPDETVPSTARLNFAQKTETAPEQAEEAQQEAMTAEAEETPVATTEDVPEAPVAEAEAQTETSEPVQAEPVIGETEGLVDPVNTEAAHEAYRESEVEAQTTDVLAEADTEAGNTANPFEDAVPSTEVTEDTTPSVETTVSEAVAETAQELAVEEPEVVVPEIQVEHQADEKSVEELTAERAKLDAEIEKKRSAEKQSVISQIKNVMEMYSVSLEELVEALGGLKTKRKGAKAQPKYRDPATGVVWSGRGKEPAWIKGQDRNNFLIS